MVVQILERGPQVSGTAAAFLVLSTIAVLLRCYCRAVVVKNFAMDDWAAFVSWIAFVLYGTFSILGVYHGTGQQSVNIPPAELPIGVKVMPNAVSENKMYADFCSGGGRARSHTWFRIWH